MTPEEIKAEMARLQEMLDAQARTEGPEAASAEGKGKGAQAKGRGGKGKAGQAAGAEDVVDNVSKPAQIHSEPIAGETVGAEESAASVCQPVSQSYNMVGGEIVETSATALRTREELERSLRMETVIEACRRLSEGQSLRTISNDPDMPSMGTFLRWAHDDAEIGQMYMVALRLRAAGLAEEIIDLSDEADRAESSHEVQAYKLRVEARKWVASRLLPKQYGEKVEHEHSGEVKMDAKAVDARLEHLVARIRGIPQSKG